MDIVGKAGVVLDDAVVVGRTYEYAGHITFGQHGLHGCAVGVPVRFGDEIHVDALILGIRMDD